MSSVTEARHDPDDEASEQARHRGHEAAVGDGHEPRDGAQRERATARCDPPADGVRQRLHMAMQRDRLAHARDRDARLRDELANARDIATAQRLGVLGPEDDRAPIDCGAEIVARTAELRARADRDRMVVVELLAQVKADREAAAHDRSHAARDRLRALADRERLACQVAAAETDAVTGARTRAAGLRDLDGELARCQRDGATLVLAYFDVVGLKAVNDRDGHLAGDELLQRVVSRVTAHARVQDLIIRLGGDEFVCAMPDTTLNEARERLRTIATQLAAALGRDAIRAGFAQLTADDSTSRGLIARADRELLDNYVAERRDRKNGAMSPTSRDARGRE